MSSKEEVSAGRLPVTEMCRISEAGVTLPGGGR